MNFEAIPDLLADILNEQRHTTAAVIRLAEALAGIRGAPATAPATAAPATAAPATAAPATAAPETAAPALDYAADVAPLIMAHAKAHGKAAALEKLAAFGVKSGSALAPDQYADVVAAFK